MPSVLVALDCRSRRLGLASKDASRLAVGLVDVSTLVVSLVILGILLDGLLARLLCRTITVLEEY
jgi:hypothetical protein